MNISPQCRRSEQGTALIVVMVLIFAMAIALLAVHSYTDNVGRQTSSNVEFLRANAAAGAAIDVVAGRLIQWVTANNGYGPSIQDCQTAGVPGNSSFPAIAGPIAFPGGSALTSYTVSTPVVDPVLPDDTIVTDPTASNYLPNVAQRLPVSENSQNAVVRYYFTHSASLNAKDVPSRSMTYKITVTVTPNVTTLTSSQPLTVTRYVRCDKIDPFSWCTYRLGSTNYYGSQTYSGPMYIANSVTFNGPSYTDSVLYGISAANNGSYFIGGGYSVQVNQSPLLSLIPNLINNLAVDSNGNRQAYFETDTTPLTPGAPDPADMFSTREVIEPPTDPADDSTPSAIQNARLYNQADVRIEVSVNTSSGVPVVSENVVNVDGSTVDPTANPWVTPLLAAINVNTVPASNPNAFMDRSRSTTQSIESTDIDVGAVGAVMAANPTVFPTRIIYEWDNTGLNGGTRPLTGVRLWDAGVLPTGGMVVGSNDPVYLKGDFNTGTTLPAGATVDTYPSVMPYSSDGLARDNTPTTEADRTVPGYTIQPAAVFGDAVIELSNSWTDANSMNTEYASSTTINLVEGWSTMSANELRPDDTYLDLAGRANPIWLEDWSNARRTMSGEELVAWHSRYCTTTNEAFGGNWVGDISYDPNATAIKVNWGSVTYVRDRNYRD